MVILKEVSESSGTHGLYVLVNRFLFPKEATIKTIFC